VECWCYGKLGFKDRSICLRADPHGCDILLRAIDEVKRDRPPAKRTLTLAHSREKNCFGTIQMVFQVPTAELTQMCIRAEGVKLIVEFTEVVVKQIESGIIDLKNGADDFCIAPDQSFARNIPLGKRDLQSEELWMWTPGVSP
jgi:hypothetical protein